MTKKSRSGLSSLLGFVGVLLLVGSVLAVALAIVSNGVFKTPTLPSAGALQSADLQRGTPIPTPLSPDMTLLDLYTQKGKLVAQGTNAAPVGIFHMTTYRIEEFTLSKPMTITRNNQTQQVSQAWRVTIGGGPFHLSALNYVIWVNDTSLGRARQSWDLSEISAVIFDRALLPNGAALAVSYGESLAERIVLPDKLKWSDVP